MNRGLRYDDEIVDTVPVTAPLTADTAKALGDQGVTGIAVHPSVPADTLSHLRAIPTLRRLDLTGNATLTDDVLTFLESMPWLTAISLARCGAVSDRGVASLRAHVGLEQVNLQWTRAGDGALAALTGKMALARLAVGTQTTDEGIAQLRDFPALAASHELDSFLSISSARSLTDRALVSIGDLQGVAALDVHMSVFGSPHYTVHGVAALRRMSALQQLNFHGGLVTDAVLREIAGIPKLRWLHSQDILSGDEGFEALARCRTLDTLITRVCRHVTDRGAAVIATLPLLRELSFGGPTLTNAALAPFAGASHLRDLNPTMSQDAAFVHIARIPGLERLTNMYNRSTSDAATAFLRNHPTLTHYTAFGTQITDDSLRVLGTMPRLQEIGVSMCRGVTDRGLAALAARPSLRRVTADGCRQVAGHWVKDFGAHVEVQSDPVDPDYDASYFAETLMMHPEMAMPPDVERPRGKAPDGLLSTLRCFGNQAVFDGDVVTVELPQRGDVRRVGVLTSDVYATPLRIALHVRPLGELRLAFADHHPLLVFGEDGSLADLAPWFMRPAVERGEAVTPPSPQTFTPDEWVHVQLDVTSRERRVLVNGVVRHVWTGDFSDVRGRIGIGLRQRSVSIRRLTVREGRL
jgi:hypothetical protein